MLKREEEMLAAVILLKQLRKRLASWYHCIMSFELAALIGGSLFMGSKVHKFRVIPLRPTHCELDTHMYQYRNFASVNQALIVLYCRESFSKEMLDERHQRADDWHRQGVVKAHTSRPPVPINCATYAQDVIEGRVAIQPNHQHTYGSPMLFGPTSVVSGSLSSDCERQIAQVFQPSHKYGLTMRLFRVFVISCLCNTHR